jgi:predicted N-acetyltransferase YhbS
VLVSATMYSRRITKALTIQCAEKQHAAAMAELQRKVFPTLSANELLTEKHFAEHISIFPEGQLVALLNGEVIGSTSTFRTKFPSHKHTFLEATGNLWLNTHDNEGEWLYGFDMGVDPDFRGIGLGRLMYKARGEICVDLGLEGQVIVGMPSGYGKVMSKVPFETYYDQMLNNIVFDPTVSMQMKMGFSPVAVISDYLVDPKCGNYGVLMTLAANNKVADPKLTANQISDKIIEILESREQLLDIAAN